MITTSGILRTGEASGAIAAVARRQRGSQVALYAIMAATTAAGFLIGGAVAVVLLVFARVPSSRTWWLPLLGGWLGLALYARSCRPYVIRRMRGRLAMQGLPAEFNSSTYLADSALEVEALGVRRIAQWSSVSELFPHGDFWIFMIALEPWFIPKRFFSSQDAQREYVRIALSKMTPEAQLRSEEARSFVGT